MRATLRLFLLGALASLLHIGCVTMQSRADLLATRLSSCNLASMATSLSGDPQVNEIWKEYPDPALLASVVEDAQRPEAVRFAAALVLRSKSVEQFRKTDPRALAHVFAAALKQGLAGWAYPWGWLWAPGDPVASLGVVFLEIGRPAIPALAALLDDKTPCNAYLGSEEATEMAMRRYRVKDFAAFYLARILHVDLPWEPDLTRRDQAIAKLRRELPP